MTRLRRGSILEARHPRRGGVLPTYISLLSWTDAGIGSFRETLDLEQAASEAATSMGGSLKDTYWCLGPYDVVAVAEFPDDETATAWLLKLGSQGSIRTTSMRAFSREEMAGILEKAS